ncbi:MAG: GcrA family cell cycle regulator [Pseudomonadota bacterium]
MTVSQKVEWDQATTDKLKQMWADGYSASQCASFIQGATKNAILGKVHRLGMQRGVASKAATREPTAKKLPKGAVATSHAPVRGQSHNALLDLKPGQCRAIVSADGEPLRFCCKPTIEGKSWCEHHAEVYLLR